jgi:hypothetical protein
MLQSLMTSLSHWKSTLLHPSKMIELTYPSLKWSPHSDLYAEEEMKRVDKEGYARKFKGTRRASSVIDDDGEFIRCINALTVSPTEERSKNYDAYNISEVKTDNFKMNSDILCKNWGIGKNIA